MLLTADERKWAEKLAEHGVTAEIRAEAAELLAGAISHDTIRLCRVAAWSYVCGDRHVMEHAPGGLGATAGEIARARRWMSADKDRFEAGYYVAILYAAPAPPPSRLGHCSMEGLARDLAVSVASIRQRAWHEAHEWTPNGYKLRRGYSDPADSWAESPAIHAAKIFPPRKPDTCQLQIFENNS